jgi:glycosyltransferase involved in cell wall biosynthesis
VIEGRPGRASEALAELVAAVRPDAAWASGPSVANALRGSVVPVAVDVQSLARQLLHNEVTLRLRAVSNPADRHRLLSILARAPSELRAERAAWKAAALLTACSPQVIKDLPSWAKKKAVLVQSGCSPRELSPSSPSQPRILFVGTLHYPPNAEAAQLLVEQILPRVRLDRPDVELDLVGACPPVLARRFANADGVTWHGFVEDLGPYYDRATLTAIPLVRSTGTNMKILEAMGYGLPVITTSSSVAGLPALVAGHDLIVVRDWSDCADAVLNLLGDPAARRDLARSAHDRVQTQYSWDAIRRNLREAIAVLAGR